MIRRKVSTGLLRAASKSTTATSSASNASASAVGAAVGASPMQQQSASLASAVLLSSQRSWKGETVATLKGELKKRGLSQSGNKSTLVARLTSAETSQHLPPSPSVPASYRKISTTSSVNAGTGEKKSIPSNSDDTATLSNTKEMTTGPEISSKTAEAEKFEEPTKEALNAAPGLPASGKVAPSSGEKLSVKLPQSREQSDMDQIIPLEPDNFRSKVDSKPAEQQTGADDVPDPKVSTVAAASTHLSGGPVSAIHETAEQASEALSDLDPAAGFKGAGESLASAVNSLTSVSKTAGEFTRSFIPEIGLPKPPKGGKGGDYKAPKEGLDEGEKKGLWVLGGIVGLGLLLGGSGSSKKDRLHLGQGASHLKDDIKNMAGMGKKGVKGDAEWEKASGANVVGHGSRKE